MNQVRQTSKASELPAQPKGPRAQRSRPLLAHRTLMAILVRARPLLPMAFYRRLWFFAHTGYWPDFADPRTFNEKIWWLKQHYRSPLLATYADKLAVRDHVARQCPALRLPELYFATSDATCIPFDRLPRECVIKSNHTTGHVLFYENGITERAEVVRTCARWLRQPHGRWHAEWAYDGIPRRVFGEQRLRADDGSQPADYKFFVLNGSTRFIQVNVDRYTGHTKRLYDSDWNVIDVEYMYPTGRKLPRPANLPELCAMADQLAGDFPLARVDLYIIGAHAYFGEMTFYPHSGTGPFWPQRYDAVFGAMLQLPRVD